MTATAVATAATWYAVAGDADVYWRVRVPANAIGARVALIPHDQGIRILSEPNLHTTFPWVATADGAEYPSHDGVAVFTRPDQVRAAHALAMKEYAGAPRIVAELDDNYAAENLVVNVADTGRQQLMLQRVNWEKRRAEHLEALLVFDAIVVSTPWLRDVYAKVFRKEYRERPEIHVCGNHVDPADWPERSESNRLRVGWMGGSSHALDVGLIYPALRWAAEAGHEATIIGYDPHWSPQDEAFYKGPMRPAGYGFQYTHIPWQRASEFDRKDADWPLDIGLAPLQRTQLSLGRSDSKCLEYAMAGAAIVCSNQEPYRDWVHGETCLKANSREDYLRAVQTLAQDAVLRERLVESAQQYVREERLIEHHRHEWEAAVYG